MSYHFVLGATGHQVLGALGAGMSFNVKGTISTAGGARGSGSGGGGGGARGAAPAPTLPDCGSLPSFARDCCEKVKKTSGGFDQKAKAIKDCAIETVTDEAKKLIPCKEARVTGVSYIDDAIVECCEEIKRGSGGTVGQKVKGIADCIGHNVARAGGAILGTAAAAAACAATGIGASIAVFCGMVGGALGGAVGGFIYDRVSGYSTTQIVGGLVAGAVCTAFTGIAGPFCAMAAAELIGWLSDSVGPIIEGIFDPGAAKRRELAARAAYHHAIEANEKSSQQADEHYQIAWGLGVHALKELYRKAFPSAADLVKAKKILGFGPVYDDVARAMRSAGASAMELTFVSKGTRGCFADPAWECANCGDKDYIRTKPASSSSDPWDGIIAAWTVEGRPQWSNICPFSIYQFYLTEREKALGKNPSRDAVTAWEIKFAPSVKEMADQIYPAMVKAIANVATQITTAGVALKQQQVIQAAHTATRENMAVRIANAASRAEAAADAAKKGGKEEGKRSVQRANQQYDIAVTTYNKLLFDEFGGKPTSSGAAASQAISCARDVSCRKAGAGVARAAVAKKNAPIFAAQAANHRLILGGVIAASVVGATYLAIRK